MMYKSVRQLKGVKNALEKYKTQTQTIELGLILCYDLMPADN